MSSRDARGLTAKQARFVQEYLVDLNATQAAIRAGYSEKTAYSQGHDLLKKPEITVALDDARRSLSKRVEVDQEWVIKRLKLEAERETEGASHAARVSALEKLGKHLGMFVERQEVTGRDGAPIAFSGRIEIVPVRPRHRDDD